jgi:hypothetical protein
MHFSEDDLRSALKRKDPGAGFTQRVMAQVHQAEDKVASPADGRTGLGQWWWPLGLRLRLRTGLAAALVAVLAFAAWMGVAHYRQVQERREGEMAKQQAVLALRITTAKLNHVFERVQASRTHEVDIRREHL